MLNRRPAAVARRAGPVMTSVYPAGGIGLSSSNSAVLHPGQLGGDLQRLVAVGADGDRHDQRRGHPRLMLDQGGQQLQEARGLGSGVGVEQFLGLIQRQHQGGGGLLGGHIEQPGAGDLAGLLQPAPQPLHLGGQAGVLDLPQHRLRQPEVGAQLVDGVGQAEFAGEHRALGAHDVHGQELRSSRRSLGSSPARRNDDLPAPDGPRITNSDSTPLVRMPRSTSRPRRIWASRPKNTAASASSSGAHPRYGARSGSPGGGQGK